MIGLNKKRQPQPSHSLDLYNAVRSATSVTVSLRPSMKAMALSTSGLRRTRKEEEVEANGGRNI